MNTDYLSNKRVTAWSLIESFKPFEKQIELGNTGLANVTIYQASLTYYSFVSSNNLALRLYDNDFYYLARAFSQKMQQVPLSNQYETESTTGY